MEQNNIIIDYDETEKLFPSRAKEIRSILQDKYNINTPNECDEFLLRCLRLKDGNLEKSIKLIKAFHVATEDFHNWDATLQPTMYRELYDTGGITPLNTRDRMGRRIYVIRTELWDPSKNNFDEVMAVMWMMAQYCNAEYKDVQRLGVATIWDFRNFGFQQAWAVKQWRLLSLAKWVQNGVAGRIKAFHAVNHPKVIGMIYGGIKPFLKEKLRKRVLFHDSFDSLHKHVDPESLPTYLGGTLDTLDCIDKPTVKGLLHSDEYFQDIMNNRFPSK